MGEIWGGLRYITFWVVEFLVLEPGFLGHSLSHEAPSSLGVLLEVRWSVSRTHLGWCLPLTLPARGARMPVGARRAWASLRQSRDVLYKEETSRPTCLQPRLASAAGGGIVDVLPSSAVATGAARSAERRKDGSGR